MRYRIARCCHHCSKWNVLAPGDRLAGRFPNWFEALAFVDRQNVDDYHRYLAARAGRFT